MFDSKYIAKAVCTMAIAVAWLGPAVQAKPVAIQPKANQPGYRSVTGGTIQTLLPPDGKQAPVTVSGFALRVRPVTVAEFSRFIQQQPQWSKSRIAGGSLADGQYLRVWSADTRPGPAKPSQPVTDVSWFAAQAYCQSEGARLPTWYEWEYAAAADGLRRDARRDPQWRARILHWYGQTSKALPAVGKTPKNVYGIQDLHGVIWEWVDDFGALMVGGDNRTQGDPDTLQFCGAGALSANDRENYPILMRIAMLSSLGAASTNRNLGFRCARDVAGSKP
ncbi:MAG: formylglycine-generating enzyme family protein [Burkholderiaceae bacterium]